MRIGNVEVAVIAANPAELKQLNLSRWLSWEAGYLGGIGRLIVFGWGLEVYIV